MSYELVFLEPSLILNLFVSILFLGFSFCHECTNFIFNEWLILFANSIIVDDNSN